MTRPDAALPASPLAHVVAGAVFDFAGYLATQPAVTDVSDMLVHVRAWASHRSLPLHGAYVMDWETQLTHLTALRSPASTHASAP